MSMNQEIAELCKKTNNFTIAGREHVSDTIGKNDSCSSADSAYNDSTYGKQLSSSFDTIRLALVRL